MDEFKECKSPKPAKPNFDCCRHCSNPCKSLDSGHPGNCQVCQPRPKFGERQDGDDL